MCLDVVFFFPHQCREVYISTLSKYCILQGQIQHPSQLTPKTPAIFCLFQVMNYIILFHLPVVVDLLNLLFKLKLTFKLKLVIRKADIWLSHLHEFCKVLSYLLQTEHISSSQSCHRVSLNYIAGDGFVAFVLHTCEMVKRDSPGENFLFRSFSGDGHHMAKNT